MDIKRLLPNMPTVLIVVLLIAAQQVWAGPLTERLAAPSAGTSKTTISYQGYLADTSGAPVNDAVDMVFRLYDAASGGVDLWSETHNGVVISDGLFSVLLGSQNELLASTITDNSDLWLGITVGSDEEMSPREKIASAPYAMISDVLDGSITTAKLADNAVTGTKIAGGTIGSSDVADNSLTAVDLAAGSVGSSEVADNSLTATDLAAGSVGSDEIINSTIVASDLAPNSVNTSEITDGQVTSADIANNTVAESDIVDTFKARDADKLDGHDTGYFVAASGDTMTGNLRIDASSGYSALRFDNDDRIEYRDSEGNGSFYFNADNGTGNARLVAQKVISPANTNLTIDPGSGSINTLILHDKVEIYDDLPPGGRNLQIGDDGWFSDIDTTNTIAFYGNSSGNFGYLKTYITSPSSQEYKTDIAPLADENYQSIMQVIEDMELVYYHLLNEDDVDSALRLGMISEEAPKQIVSEGGKGIDLYELSSFTLAGLKALGQRVNETQFTADGLAQLENGQARVELNMSILDSIEPDFLVHLTPYGDVSVYVAEIGADYFLVKARDGDDNAQFAWQLSSERLQ